jgi:hypothetical protein
LGSGIVSATAVCSAGELDVLVAAADEGLRRDPPSKADLVPIRWPGAPLPRAVNANEEAFLASGPGAAEWLRRGAAGGAARMGTKMTDAVPSAKRQI